VSPEWVKIRLGGDYAPRSVEEGADMPVWLATLPDGGPSGGFFNSRRPFPGEAEAEKYLHIAHISDLVKRGLIYAKNLDIRIHHTH
jgi:hypothetical protein